ncbi:MAG: DUF4034 domain-containing protein [Pseudohongiellaceae bacterium]
MILFFYTVFMISLFVNSPGGHTVNKKAIHPGLLTLIFLVLASCGPQKPCNEPPFYCLDPVDEQIAIDYYGGSHPARADIISNDELLQLFRARDFTAIESYFKDFNTRFNNGEIPEGLYNDVFNEDNFYEFSLSDNQLFDQWANENPASSIAHGIRGLYYYHLGWKIRGSGCAGCLPDARWNLVNDNFDTSLNALEKSIELDPYFQAVYYALIGIARVLSQPEVEIKYYELGITNFPASFAIRTHFMNGLQPRWGGSYEAMREFALSTYPIWEQNPRMRAILNYEEADRGTTFRLDNEFELATEAYTNSLYHGIIGGFLEERASMYLRDGNRFGYTEDFRKLIQLNPSDHPTAWMYIAIETYERSGGERAWDEFVQALRSDRLKERTETIVSYLHDIDPERTLVFLRSKLEENEKNIYYQYGLAWELQLLKDRSAIDEYRKFLDMCSYEICNDHQIEIAQTFFACLEGDSSCYFDESRYSWAL